MATPEKKLDESITILNQDEVTDDDLDEAVSKLNEVKQFFDKKREIQRGIQRKYYYRHRVEYLERKKERYNKKKMESRT